MIRAATILRDPETLPTIGRFVLFLVFHNTIRIRTCSRPHYLALPYLHNIPESWLVIWTSFADIGRACKAVLTLGQKNLHNTISILTSSDYFINRLTQRCANDRCFTLNQGNFDWNWRLELISLLLNYVLINQRDISAGIQQTIYFNSTYITIYVHCIRSNTIGHRCLKCVAFAASGRWSSSNFNCYPHKMMY